MHYLHLGHTMLTSICHKVRGLHWCQLFHCFMYMILVLQYGGSSEVREVYVTYYISNFLPPSDCFITLIISSRRFPFLPFMASLLAKLIIFLLVDIKRVRGRY